LLNAKIQGKGKLHPDVFSYIKTSEMKLKLINKHSEERNLAHLRSCKSVFETSEENVCMVKGKISEIIQQLQN
jgi:hypothetical protein